MHPEIKQFWIDAGYEVEEYIENNKITGYTAYGRVATPLALFYGGICRYFLNDFSNKLYTEEEMLKIIKLKAFI